MVIGHWSLVIGHLSFVICHSEIKQVIFNRLVAYLERIYYSNRQGC